MHAFPPKADDPPSTDNTPWGVALGQTLATPRMPEPQASPLTSGPPAGSTPHQGPWGVEGGCGDAHASNSPSPAGEAALTTPTDLLLQVQPGHVYDYNGDTDGSDDDDNQDTDNVHVHAG